MILMYFLTLAYSQKQQQSEAVQRQRFSYIASMIGMDSSMHQLQSMISGALSIGGVSISCEDVISIV